jgi:hypothetical protein
MMRRVPQFSAVASRWLTAAGVVVLLGGSYGGYRMYWYTEHDPRFCKSCHLMQDAWDRWLVSEHNKLDCHQCHHTTKLEGMRQLWLYITQRPTEVPPHAPVPPDVCKDCHGSGDRKWRQVLATTGHQVHVQQQKLKCLDCHAKSLHRFSAPTNVCRSCHETKVKMAGMDDLHCTSCHSFLTQEQSLVPTRGTCLWCHSQPGHTHVEFGPDSPMQFGCAMCHDPHNSDPFLQHLRKRCRTCHPKEAKTVTMLGPKHRDCLTCHRPHTWTVDDGRCRSCHERDLEGVAAHRVERHKTAELGCTKCHQPHVWKPGGIEACRRCHQFIKETVHPEGWKQRHGRAARKTGALCEACHTQTMCTDCHGKVPLPHPTNWPSLHRDYAKRDPKVCRRCHQPKQFCGSCHASY